MSKKPSDAGFSTALAPLRGELSAEPAEGWEVLIGPPVPSNPSYVPSLSPFRFIARKRWNFKRGRALFQKIRHYPLGREGRIRPEKRPLLAGIIAPLSEFVKK
jgi:hypothetical protein